MGEANGGEARRRTHARLLQPDDVSPDAPPPFHTGGVNMLFLVGMMESTSARALVPTGLEPTDHGATNLVFYEAASGYGLGPFTAFYSGTTVKGHDSPDESEAWYLNVGVFSGRAGILLPRHYGHQFQAGAPVYRRDGNCIEASAEFEGCRFAVRGRTRPESDFIAGIHKWIVTYEDRFGVFTTPWSSIRSLLDVETFEIEVPEGHRLAPLRAFRPAWAEHCVDLSWTWTEPEPIDTAVPEPREQMLLRVLAQLGRPAAMVSGDGRILYANPDAQALIPGKARGRLRSDTLGDQAALDRAIAEASSSGHASGVEPIVLARRDTGPPVLAQILSLGLTVTGERAALVLLNDTGKPPAADLIGTLRLLGLTPAEARIGALVGGGLTPREAAVRLAITEQTVRSTIKIIYSKLAINRQAELVRLVARLQA